MAARRAASSRSGVDPRENANLFLQPPAVGVDELPSVPYWDIDLFRVPRNWATLYVDASNGTILKKMFCDIPCDS